MKTVDNNGVPEVHPSELISNIGKVSLIDVRRPDEYIGELGHIDGAVLITLGPDLEKHLNSLDKNTATVFICRSGARSGQATLYSRSLGFDKTYNMTGGMLLWNELKLPTTT